MGRTNESGYGISLEDVEEVLQGIPNPFGTFKKAKYVIKQYGVILYSCVTTCRSEENMLELLMEKSEYTCYMREYPFVSIVKIQDGKEKVLFKGNIFKGDSIRV
jgi:hypothetical protein